MTRERFVSGGRFWQGTGRARVEEPAPRAEPCGPAPPRADGAPPPAPRARTARWGRR